MLLLVKSAVQMDSMLQGLNHFRAVDLEVDKSLRGIPTSNPSDIADEINEVLEVVVEMLILLDGDKGGAA